MKLNSWFFVGLMFFGLGASVFLSGEYDHWGVVYSGSHSGVIGIIFIIIGAFSFNAWWKSK